MRPAISIGRHASAAVAALTVGLSLRGLAAEAVPRRSAADRLAAAGDVRVPANRDRVVAELRRAEDDRRTDAVAHARLRGLPTRIEEPGGGASELVGWNGERPLYYTTLNTNAAISTGSNLIRVSPYFATGAGGTIGIWDGGAVRATHQEFGGRVTVKDGAALLDHATHVGGTLGASGFSARARGMAVAVQIDSYDWNSDQSEMASRGASYPGEPGKLYISNHSYGMVSGWSFTGTATWYGSGQTQQGVADDFGRYDEYARDGDALAHTLPYYLMFWAAGNDRDDNPTFGMNVKLSPSGSVVAYDPAQHPPGDGVYRSGYDTIGYAALAKNVVTVGAVDDAATGGLRDLSKATMLALSNWGPTDDGRIKPDVVANGSAVYSTSSGANNSYATMTGTSMATPNAAGTAQQLVSYYGTCFPGQALRTSTLKGLLIHTADDLGPTGPDYRFGWGLVNGKAAADLIAATKTNGAPRLLEQRLTADIPARTHRLDWDGSSPIRVTLCWTDPAGVASTDPDSRAPRLVNDLNLRLVGPTGTAHLPWVMPFVGVWTTNTLAAPAVFGTNHTDNVEQVYVAAPPAAGAYTAVVSFSGALAGGQQDYSLLLSGTAAPPPTLITVR